MSIDTYIKSNLYICEANSSNLCLLQLQNFFRVPTLYYYHLFYTIYHELGIDCNIILYKLYSSNILCIIV